MKLIKTLISKDLGLNEKNWGIYLPSKNGLRILDDNILFDYINKNEVLRFYPKVVIR